MQSSAAILAGGRATRFGGRDKGALVVGGRMIRDRQLDVLRQISDDIIMVGGEDREVPGVRHVPDLATACGPLGGVYTALLEAVHEQTIVLACDLPFVTVPLLTRLVDAVNGGDVAVPRTVHGMHPLCGVYTRRALDAIADRIQRGRLKMTDVFDDLRVHVIEADEIAVFGEPDRLLANVNTPEEYGRLETLEDHEL